MPGTLYGVGVGPGDPELLTLKAVRILTMSDIIAIPGTDLNTCVAYNIAKQSVPNIKNKSILYISMPMTKDKSLLEESHINGANQLIKELEKEKKIAFLTLGDPTVYSTYMYLHKRVIHAGYSAEIINGIPSFCAVAARLGDCLVENAEQLHIIPSSYPVEEALTLSGTKVFMKSGKKIGEVKRQLITSGLNGAMIENCGMDSEKIYKNIHDIPEQSGYYSLIIVKES